MTESPAKIRVTDLKKHFTQSDDLLSRLMGDSEMVKAVDGVSLSIKEGEALGVAGESGCGKSTLARAILRLHEPTDGKIYFEGNDLLAYGGDALNEFRRDAQIIQQNPYQSVNPRFKIRSWVREPLDIHGIGTREEREELVVRTLNDVGLRPPENFLNDYPSELSGGQRQRVGIARAIVTDPSFLVCDEPVSMLDVSIRAEILELLNKLQSERDMSALFISHDLSMLKHMCDRIAIMYLGRIVEIGTAKEIINDPKHPYTRALVSSTPIIDPNVTRERINIDGQVPDPVNLPSGCRFAPRCPDVMDECEREEPPMYEDEDGRKTRCVLYDDEPVQQPPMSSQ